MAKAAATCPASRGSRRGRRGCRCGAASRAWAARSSRPNGCSMQSKPESVEIGQVVRCRPRCSPVGVDLERTAAGGPRRHRVERVEMSQPWPILILTRAYPWATSPSTRSISPSTSSPYSPPPRPPAAGPGLVGHPAGQRTRCRRPASGCRPPPSPGRRRPAGPGNRRSQSGDGIQRREQSFRVRQGESNPGTSVCSRAANASIRLLGVVGGIGQGGAFAPAFEGVAAAGAGHSRTSTTGRRPMLAAGRPHRMNELQLHRVGSLSSSRRMAEPAPSRTPRRTPSRRPGPPRRAMDRKAYGRGTGHDRSLRSTDPGSRPPRRPSGALYAGPPLARVAEWQTRWTQNPLSERACGFESRPGHPLRGRGLEMPGEK